MVSQSLTRQWPTARRRALLLVLFTMIYNIAEGVVALSAGTRADSIALFGFGIDSIIECLAAAALLWRLTSEDRDATRERVERTERRASRIVGATFLALALYVMIQSGIALVAGRQPDASIVGIVVAIASLLIMPMVSWWKLRTAAQIGSRALRAEAKETLACAYLSFTLLVGLGANAVAGWWWADPVAAILMVPWLVKEGTEGLGGHGSCEECSDAEDT